MVAHLLRLHLTLTRRRLTTSVWQIVGLCIAALYGLGLGAVLFFSMAALGDFSVRTHAELPILLFGLLTLMWLFLSVLITGVNQTLDPARFSLLPLRARELVPGMAVVGLFSVGSVVCLLGGLGLAVGWFPRSVAAGVVALVAGLLGALTGVVANQAIASTFATMLGSRRFKDLAGLLMFVLIMAFSIGMQFLGGSGNRRPDQLDDLMHSAADVLPWTPLGAAWALPGDVATASWGLLAAHLASALVWLGLLGWLWVRMLDRALCSPLTSGAAATKVKADSWIDRFFPATVSGAIGARTTRYWKRDNRHLISLLSMLVMPVLFLVPMLVNGNADRTVLAFAAPILALFMGAYTGQELIYDGTSISTHMLAGVTGREDRWGRVLGIGLVMVPLSVLMAVMGAAVGGRWDLLPATLGLTLCALGVGMGMGLMQDVLVTYPYPPPGGNPFGKNSAGTPLAFVAVLVNLAATGVVSGPALFMLIGYVTDGPWWLAWGALAYGLVVGPLVLWGMLVWSGKVLDKRWPEVLDSVRDGKE